MGVVDDCGFGCLVEYDGDDLGWWLDDWCGDCGCEWVLVVYVWYVVGGCLLDYCDVDW